MIVGVKTESGVVVGEKNLPGGSFTSPAIVTDDFVVVQRLAKPDGTVTARRILRHAHRRWANAEEVVAVMQGLVDRGLAVWIEATNPRSKVIKLLAAAGQPQGVAQAGDDPGGNGAGDIRESGTPATAPAPELGDGEQEGDTAIGCQPSSPPPLTMPEQATVDPAVVARLTGRELLRQVIEAKGTGGPSYAILRAEVQRRVKYNAERLRAK